MAADTPSVRWDENGRPHWTHRCVTGAVEVQLPLAPDCWQKGDGDTLTPSINCQDCRTHGFWTNGQWWWSGVPRDVADALAERRADADFRARVDHRLRADRRILDRLKDGDR